MDELLDGYGGLVWSLARRFCPERSEAEDAVQEIFAEIWRSAARYNPEMGSEATFIATIARRRLINRLRRTKRDVGRLSEATPAVDPASPVGEAPAVAEDAGRAMKALETLPAEQQRVLRLAVIHGVSHEKIAQSTGQPLGTVKSQIRRGLIKIRDLLAEQGVETDRGSVGVAS